ncbi:MAG: hypothetical protein QW140_01820 [Candidatus Aenigmatarchaeota archaeon]
MKDKNVELISYLLEREGVTLPLKIMKNRTIVELGRALKKPCLMSRFFSKMASNLHEYLKKDELEKFQNKVEEIKTLFKDSSISNEDIDIINFLINKIKFLELVKFIYFLQIIGPLIYSLEILEEIRNRNLSKLIIVFIYINLYVTIYEIVLHLVDRTLYEIVKSKEEWKKQNKEFFERINREEYNDHATAGQICKVLENFGLNTENSIFGGKSETRIFRNKISHANIFYDSEEDKILINGTKYDFQEFKKLFSRLFFFLVKWIELWLNIDNFYEFSKKLKKEMKKDFQKLSHVFLKIERSGEMKNIYFGWVLRLEKKVESE